MDIVHSINLALSTNLNFESYYDQAQRLKNNTESHFTASMVNSKKQIQRCSYNMDIMNALHKSVMYEGNMEAGKELFDILPRKIVKATIECDVTLQHKFQEMTQNTIRMFRRNGIEGYLHIANYYLKVSSNINTKSSNPLKVIDSKLFKAGYSLIIAINSALEQLSFEFDQNGTIFDFVFENDRGVYVQITTNGNKWVVNPEFLSLLKNASDDNYLGECLSEKISILRAYGLKGYLDYLIHTALLSIEKLQSYVLFEEISEQ